MSKILMAVILLTAFTSEAWSQTVPEGIHTDAEGPSQMCGFTGANALDLIRQVTASPSHRRVSGTDRFEFYLSADEMDALVFTRPSEPVHPAITCRHLSRDEAGNLYLSRDMRCEASRDACDRLFLEFQSLDDAVREGLQRRQSD